MSYRINILPSAEGDLSGLDNTTKRRILAKLSWLSENIQNINPKRFTGKLQGLYKLRIGDYRIVYEISHPDRLIRVHFIGHRKDIYKAK